MAPALPAFHPAVVGEHGQAPLLAFIKRLVERVGRIGDFLERRLIQLGALGKAAKAHGVKIDKRWNVERIKAELEKAA